MFFHYHRHYHHYISEDKCFKKEKKDFHQEEMFLTMKMNVFLLCVILTIVECRSIFNEELNDSWILFQRIHKKIYSTIQEEILRSVENEKKISSFRFECQILVERFGKRIFQ